jgi:5-dehydro-2-deoxygluconokinase
MKPLDIIAIGRAGVDLYGEQVGGRLEDMASFAKYLGGSPTNTAVGLARLGLNAGLITRVGGDHMGRFIREELVREGVDTRGVRSDPARLTALVLLGIRENGTYPLIFYRQDCADMALCEADIDPALIAQAGAVLLSGTHFSTAQTAAACRRAATLMRGQGGRVVLDVDYRPVLWDLAPRDAGEDRFVASHSVTATMQRALDLVDLVVGTEEEIHLLGGSTNTLDALRSIRTLTDAPVVVKRGAKGCVVFEGVIPGELDEGLVAPAFAVPVANVLGAGDGFMAGFLRGWLRGADGALGRVGQCLRRDRGGAPRLRPGHADLAGAGGVHGGRGARSPASLEQMHWATTRAPADEALTILAIDHRGLFETLIDSGGGDEDRVATFKDLASQAMERTAAGDRACGLLLDGRFGARALAQSADAPYWIGRPIEISGSRPLRFEGGADVAITLRSWPRPHAVKCNLRYHPDDPADLRAEQDAQLLRLFDATRGTGHELLLEIIAAPYGPVAHDTVARVMAHVYALGIYPDWWKLEATDDPAAWAAIEAVIADADPWCRGVVVLGAESSPAHLARSFAAAAPRRIVKGFAVGRAIWHDVAQQWFTGMIDDETALVRLTANFAQMVTTWREARSRALAPCG